MKEVATAVACIPRPCTVVSEGPIQSRVVRQIENLWTAIGGAVSKVQASAFERLRVL